MPSRYKKIRIGNKTVDEHRYVWEQHNGPIPAGAVIHHVNRDKQDNRIENLELSESRSAHAKEHFPRGVWENMTEEHRKKWEEKHRAYHSERDKRKPGAKESWCWKCKRFLPVEAFTKNAKNRNGLEEICRECRKKSRKRPSVV